MRRGHKSAAALPAVGSVWAGLFISLPWWVAGGMGLLVWVSCMWPDLDHPAKRGPVAWMVRGIAWRIWLMTRTSKDRVKKWGDTHRDFTHSVEGAAVFGTAAGGVTTPLLLIDTYPISLLSNIGEYAVWWGIGVFLGCLSHIMADSMTPSGVPGSIILNRVLGYGTWQRWCVGWVWVPIRRLAYPRLCVIRIHWRRQECEHRGLFRTDSAGEKFLAVPLLWTAAVVLVAVGTGFAGPVMDAVFGLFS